MDNHAIVIVTYNRLELLRQCLDAVRAQTRPYDRIIIVDNASTDGSRQWLCRLQGEPGLRILFGKKNIGGAGGFAKGLMEAVKLDADWITLIDDDAMLRPDFLHQICQAIRRTDGRYASYAGIPLTKGIRPGHRRRVRGTILKRETAVPKAEYRKEFFTCDIASFCGLVVSAEAVRKVGYPRQDFFIWFDDTEYSLRLSRISPVLNWNKAVIDHRAKVGEPAGPAGWKDYYGIRNKIIVAGLYYNRTTFWWTVLKKTGRALVSSLSLAADGSVEKVPDQLRLYRDGILDGIEGRTGFCRKYGP